MWVPVPATASPSRPAPASALQPPPGFRSPTPHRPALSRRITTPAGAAVWAAKRALDLAASLIALLALLALAAARVLANPLGNPGPVFFRHRRMGRHGCAFTIVKFRTMRAAPRMLRGPAHPLETDRITPLGRWLRRLRLDALPQVVNVLRGEMSLIGPRPDCIEHARACCERLPGYRDRLAVRPGISGPAKVTLGYAEGLGPIRSKAALDRTYIARASWRPEARIALATLRAIATGFGVR
jgi:lipopolysaccharide/colanic/teichoic acid biosynthesis glycosyltransferase